MFKFLNTKKQDSIDEIAKKQLKKNKDVLESLRDYDAGKKVISTDTARKRFPHIRTS